MVHKNKTVVRSMDILNLFITHSELTFQEIIDLSGIPKTSVYRMLGSLEAMGFLEKGEHAKYRLGLLFLKFGSLVSSRLDIRQIAYPLMKELHNEIEEAVNLIVQQGDEAVYIEKIDTKQKVRLYTEVGRISPLYAGACSRIILSFLTDEEIRAYLDKIELEQIGLGTITDQEELLARIELARKEGYTVSNSELENHTTSIAAPIFNQDGKVIGGLSIAGFEANYDDDTVACYSKKAMKVAAEISSRLGYQE